MGITGTHIPGTGVLTALYYTVCTGTGGTAHLCVPVYTGCLPILLKFINMGGVYPKPSPAPPFDLRVPRFDQSTFAGRWMSFQQSTDFRTLFIDEDTIKRSLGILETYKKNAAAAGPAASVASITKYTNDELWEARRVVEATCHPETNEPIFAPVRFAALHRPTFPFVRCSYGQTQALLLQFLANG